ncbi:MAG TPA: Mur ligase family protein, partial [Gemmataceae bacterium]|nr:Mur ligase family protein [Gemmataceae bacterium]
MAILIKMADHSTLTRQAPMTYEEAIAFWFGRINYEQRTPRLTDFKLDRMRTLLDLLGNPQHRLRIVHVAGSKGKGSTSAMLESILRHAGYRTGLFTSPHLSQVEERIQVDARPIPPQALAALMNEIRAAIHRMEEDDFSSATASQGATFFEVATALGFLYFARQEVDLAVVEVGLGGRFDSTNVCQPLVSVITSISFDHTQQLGNRLAEIAMEKAGIVKPDRPTISGVTDPEPRQVIEAICRERHSSLQQLGTDLHFQHRPGQVFKEETRNQKPEKLSVVRVTTARRAWPAMKLGLWGEHQAANAALAVACVELLQDQGLRIA